MDAEAEKFINLTKKAEELKTKKIRIEEQCKQKESELRKLVSEIQNAGFNPKDLKKVIEEKDKKIKKDIEDFEKSLEEVSEKLSAVEEG